MIKKLRKGAWIRRDGDHRVLHIDDASEYDLYFTTHQASDGAVLGRFRMTRSDAASSLKSQGGEFCDPPDWYKRGA